MQPALQKKYEILKARFQKLERVLIAFSGGVDSVLVSKIAHDVLGDDAIAITADSPSLPRKELEAARAIAREIGIPHHVIRTDEIQNPDYRKNPNNRCYYCKTELYTQLKQFAKAHDVTYILNGTNLDDLSDHRPGLVAASENKVKGPLEEAGLSKAEVRALAKHLGLRAWDKPSSPCLSSRIPYGQEVNREKLAMIEAAEDFLKTDFKIRELRVRHFGDRAHIEIRDENRPTIRENFESIEKKFHEIGFREIQIKPFRSGSLNLLPS